MEIESKNKAQVNLKNKYLIFKKNLKEPEYKQILQLDIARVFKNIYLFLLYLVWINIARIGWENSYSLYRFLFKDENEQLRIPLDRIGISIFNLIVVGMFFLFIIQATRVLIFGSPRRYTDLIRPHTRIINLFCKYGSAIFLLGVYTGEINLNMYNQLFGRLVSLVLLYLLTSLIEKKFFKKIKNGVLDEIIREEFDLNTTLGEIKVKLSIFRSDSKWKQYIYRSPSANVHKGYYNYELEEILSDTGAVYHGEEMVLKDKYGDYVIIYDDMSHYNL